MSAIAIPVCDPAKCCELRTTCFRSKSGVIQWAVKLMKLRLFLAHVQISLVNENHLASFNISPTFLVTFRDMSGITLSVKYFLPGTCYKSTFIKIYQFQILTWVLSCTRLCIKDAKAEENLSSRDDKFLCKKVFQILIFVNYLQILKHLTE